jgi:hypothetical protein
MAEKKISDEQAPPTEFIAQDDTMTCYEVTVREIITAGQNEAVRFKNESEGKDGTIFELNAQISTKNTEIKDLAAESGKKDTQIKSLERDLGIARLAAQKNATGAPGLQRLPGGGIRLMVTLDVDESAPLLSWADSAGEDPGEYIAKQIKDALVAVTSS